MSDGLPGARETMSDDVPSLGSGAAPSPPGVRVFLPRGRAISAGDAGVAWRLARRLHRDHGLPVELTIDLPQVLARLLPASGARAAFLAAISRIHRPSTACRRRAGDIGRPR
jgi:hypothetical protein